MTGKTHMIGGIAASLAYAQFIGEDPLFIVGAGIVGALIPDICHSGSTIGRKMPVVSKIMNTLFGHRTFTHSILFLVLIYIFMDRFIPSEAIQAGVLVGMISHYILDMGTRNGIKLFFPFRLTVRFPVTTRTGSKVESGIASILTVLAFYYGFQVVGYYF